VLLITKKLEETPPYNLKIIFTINNIPYGFDTQEPKEEQRTTDSNTITEETIV